MDIRHSHPGGSGTPSGYYENGKVNPRARNAGDRNTAREFPNASHSVYDSKTKLYTKYDENKFYPPK